MVCLSQGRCGKRQRRRRGPRLSATAFKGKASFRSFRQLTSHWPCWRRLLRGPWTARRGSQPILKEINPEEGLMLKLKLQYFGHLVWRANSLEKVPMLGKTESRREDRGWDDWMASSTRWRWVWASSRRWWRTGKTGVLPAVHGVAKSWPRLSDWTTTRWHKYNDYFAIISAK